MTHNFPLPDENELEQLVMQSFAALPEAEYSRIQQIEERLSRKARLQKRDKNLNKIPWWIVLVLAGSFATAAWWAGEMNSDDNDSEISADPLTGGDKLYESTDSKSDTNNESEDHDKRDSPIIYHRESY